MSDSFPSLSQTGRAFPLPTIAEDTLHYVVHLPPSQTQDGASTALLITQYVESLLPQPWIWNRDSWELKVASQQSGVGSHASTSSSSSSSLGERLEGTMRVGDAVDDEWLVVWLLKEVSRKWPDLTIGIRDSDGEFLLIEAANELPSWVSPENAQNRLWLQNAHLHLIPLNIRSSSSSQPRQVPNDDSIEREYDPEAWISEEDALRAVGTGKYRAEARIERAVWSRIACYPDGLKTHQHRTKGYLPVPVAKALSRSPELVQRAVEGFYVRDPSQLRAASRMSHFPPSPAVLAPVVMTRAAYAQLQGQVFHPPRAFGPEWHVRDNPELEGERRWRDIGVKIATGFEIMYREGGKKGRSGKIGGAEDTSTDNPAYRTFLDNLKKAGYFGQEVEGSQKWKERETEARKGYQAVRATDTASQRPSFAYQVDAAIESASSATSESLAVSPSAAEDSESWLEVSPDELDGILQRSSGRSGAQSGRSVSTTGEVEPGDEDGQALHDLAQQVEQFVGGQGDLQGARFADELSDDDDDDDMDENDDYDETEERKALEAGRQDRLDNLVPALPDAEWGQKITPEVDRSADTDGKADALKDRESKLANSELLPPKMRPPMFAKEHYDGVESDSDDEVDEKELPPPGTIGRQIALMKWGDGEDKSAQVEEINEDEEDDNGRQAKLTLDDSIDDEMQRRVWGGDEDEDEDEENQPAVDFDGDVDMLNEQEEFLKFSREALGISDGMWEGILGDRRARGAFVPEPSTRSKGKTSQQAGTKPPAVTGSAKRVDFAPAAATTASASDSGSRMLPPPPQVVGKNTSLDSFESVMRAMDAELARAKGPSKPASTSSTSKSGKTATPLSNLPTEAELDDMDDSDLLAMDRELRAALKGAGIDDPLDGEYDVEEAEELEGDQRREYEMMRDFLESYNSQGGESGVVGNLFGRLGR